MTRLPSAAADIHHPCRLYRIQAYAGWEATAPPAGDKERRDSIDMPGAALGAVLANSSNRWFRRAHDRAKTRRREITRVGSCSFSHSFSRRHSEGSDPPNAAVGLKEGSRVFDCSQRKLRSQDTVDQLVSFGQTGKLSLEHSSKEEELAQFKTDALEMRRRLKRMGRTTISPQSKFLRYWDLVTVLCLLWTAFVTPFEVGFLDPNLGPTSFNFIVNRIVDCMFFTDMVLAFFIPYRADQLNGGMWVFDNRKIASRYLKGWFPLDVLTTFPIDLILRATSTSADGGTSLPNTVRVLRIAKLARILRASRILKRWEDYISASYAVIALIKFFVIVCMLAHWLACLWGVIGQRKAPADGSLARPTWHDRLPEGMQQFSSGDAQYEYAWQLYGSSLYVALNNIFGGVCAQLAASFSTCSHL